MPKTRVLLVCTGNTCRSAMAEGLLRKMLREEGRDHVEVHSAGTIAGGGSHASENAAIACREVDVDLRGHRSTALSAQLITWADRVLCMENYHVSTVTRLVPHASRKTHLLGEFGPPDQMLEIADPVGLSLSVYRACRDRLSDCLRGVLEKLTDVRSQRRAIALGCDEAGLDIKDRIRKHLTEKDLQILEGDPIGEETGDDPSAAIGVARRIAGGLAYTGILVGETGLGMAIAANKLYGVRAVSCSEPEQAILGRKKYDANVLCLGASSLDPEKAVEIVDVWLDTDYKGEARDSWVSLLERFELEKVRR